MGPGGDSAATTEDECAAVIEDAEDEEVRQLLCTTKRGGDGIFCCYDYATGQCVQALADGSSCSDTCPWGTFSPTGTEPCTDCPAGKADDDMDPLTACSSCPYGSYSGARAKSCIQCEEGQADLDLDPNTACEACSPGTQSGYDYAALPMPPWPIPYVICEYCSAGKVDLNADARGCSDCSAGTYSLMATTGTCSPCQPGSYSSSGSAACIPCSVRLPTQAVLSCMATYVLFNQCVRRRA